MSNYVRVLSNPDQLGFKELFQTIEEVFEPNPIFVAYQRFFKGAPRSAQQAERQITAQRFGQAVIEDVARFEFFMAPFKAVADERGVPMPTLTKEQQEDEILRFEVENGAAQLVNKTEPVKRLTSMFNGYRATIKTKAMAAFYDEARAHVHAAIAEAVVTARRWRTLTPLTLAPANIGVVRKMLSFQDNVARISLLIDQRMNVIDADPIVSTMPLLSQLVDTFTRLEVDLSWPGLFQDAQDHKNIDAYHKQWYAYVNAYVGRTRAILRAK